MNCLQFLATAKKKKETNKQTKPKTDTNFGMNITFHFSWANIQEWERWVRR